jgi:hypothetical protein
LYSMMNFECHFLVSDCKAICIFVKTKARG